MIWYERYKYYDVKNGGDAGAPAQMTMIKPLTFESPPALKELKH